MNINVFHHEKFEPVDSKTDNLQNKEKEFKIFLSKDLSSDTEKSSNKKDKLAKLKNKLDSMKDKFEQVNPIEIGKAEKEANEQLVASRNGWLKKISVKHEEKYKKLSKFMKELEPNDIV